MEVRDRNCLAGYRDWFRSLILIENCSDGWNGTYVTHFVGIGQDLIFARDLFTEGGKMC